MVTGMQDKGIYEVGNVIKVTPISVSFRKNPVGLDESGQLFEIVESTNPKFGGNSNLMRSGMLERLVDQGNSEPVTVKIIHKARYPGDKYLAVCYSSNGGASSNVGDAHSIVGGPHVFQAICREKTVNRIDFLSSTFESITCCVSAYDQDGKSLFGFLQEINTRRRPTWEDWGISSLVRAETKISENIIKGSEKFGYKGLNQDDKVMVRVIADNKGLGKRTTTYFFEPVVTIRKGDKAYDTQTGESMVTCVVDAMGDEKTSYEKGDIIRNVPIVTTFNTEKFGTVGVGYLLRPAEEFDNDMVKPLSYLKKVWVIGGEDYLGSVVKNAELIANKGAIIADKGNR